MSKSRDLESRLIQPPAHPPRAVGRHTGPPNLIEGEYREVPPVAQAYAARSETVAPAEQVRAEKPDMIDRLSEWMALNHANPGEKWGAGHVGGMWRQGLKELAQALEAFPGQGVHLVEEPGVAGNLTNIEVVKGKNDTPSSPLDAVRESVRERSQDKGRYRSFEIG